MAKSFVSDYMMPHKSPMEKFQRDHSKLPDRPRQIVRETCILRGWLNIEQTEGLLALLEEDDCNLHAVLLAAGLLALSRTLQFQNEQERNSLTSSFPTSGSTPSHPHLGDTLHTSIRYSYNVIPRSAQPVSII